MVASRCSPPHPHCISVGKIVFHYLVLPNSLSSVCGAQPHVLCVFRLDYFLLMQEFSQSLQRHPLQPAILLMYIYVCHSCPWPCISNYHKKPIFLKSFNSKSFHLHFWPLTERLPVGREETSILRGNRLSLMQTKCPAKRSLR